MYKMQDASFISCTNFHSDIFISFILGCVYVIQPVLMRSHFVLMRCNVGINSHWTHTALRLQQYTMAALDQWQCWLNNVIKYIIINTSSNKTTYCFNIALENGE